MVKCCAQTPHPLHCLLPRMNRESFADVVAIAAVQDAVEHGAAACVDGCAVGHAAGAGLAVDATP
eukprot:1574594-Amphidinium_carterae.1